MSAACGTRFALRVPLAAALALVAATPLHAQNFTLGDVIDSLRRGDSIVSLGTRSPVAHRKLDSLAAVLSDANARSIGIKTLSAVITSTRIRYADANRWDPRAATLLGQPWFRSAVLALSNIANASLADTLEKVQPSLLKPTDALGTQVRADAMTRGAERLRRMSIKYGEGAPSLNVVEATANYVMQFIPGLKSAADGSPSRYEILAAYRTLEVSAYGFGTENGQFVSAGQLGLRWYHWKPGWGQGSARAQLLKPRYASAGVYVQSDDPAPLTLRRNISSVGAFLGWGSVHVAYVFDGDGRLIFGTDKQIVPHIF